MRYSTEKPSFSQTCSARTGFSRHSCSCGKKGVILDAGFAVDSVGVSKTNIFRAVTSSPARAPGKENECKYLRAGRCADIAVLEYTNERFDLTDKAGNRLKSDVGYRCKFTV